MHVETGLHVLAHHRTALLRGQRFALLSHQASVDGRLDHAIPLLRRAPGERLAALMAPEHGVWGAPQDHIHITAEVDPVTMLPVHSLYGTRRTPTSKMLRGLDALVVDHQDVAAGPQPEQAIEHRMDRPALVVRKDEHQRVAGL